MKRREIRELVIKALFAAEAEKGEALRQFSYITGDGEMSGCEGEEAGALLSKTEDAYARRLITGLSSHLDEIDGLIRAYSVDWDLERLGGVERNILRLGLYEMQFDEKLPPAIVINEALDMIKKFADSASSKFVNGILGRKAEELKISDAGGVVVVPHYREG